MIDEVPTLRDWLNMPEIDDPPVTEYKTNRNLSIDKVKAIKVALLSKTVKQVSYDFKVHYMTVYNIYKKHTFKEI